METLVIQRTKWLRGEHESFLLRDDGKMCCLGFLGMKCGLSEEDIYEEQFPSDSSSENKSKWPVTLFSGSSWSLRTGTQLQDWEGVLAKINDLDPHFINNSGLTEKDREAWLITGFRELFNIDLTFED